MHEQLNELKMLRKISLLSKTEQRKLKAKLLGYGFLTQTTNEIQELSKRLSLLSVEEVKAPNRHTIKRIADNGYGVEEYVSLIRKYLNESK